MNSIRRIVGFVDSQLSSLSHWPLFLSFISSSNWFHNDYLNWYWLLQVVFENLSIQWMKIVDWRLIRVLMIEVNMITYEVWGPPQCTQGLRSLCIYERIGEFEYHGLIMNEILILWIDSFDRKANILRAVDNHNDSVIF